MYQNQISTLVSLSQEAKYSDVFVPFRNLNSLMYKTSKDEYLPDPLINWDSWSFKKSNYSYSAYCGRRGILEHGFHDEPVYGVPKIIFSSGKSVVQSDTSFVYLPRPTERELYFSDRKRHYATIKIQRVFRRKSQCRKRKRDQSYLK
jgi:hypothetical protein